MFPKSFSKTIILVLDFCVLVGVQQIQKFEHTDNLLAFQFSKEKSLKRYPD